MGGKVERAVTWEGRVARAQEAWDRAEGRVQGGRRVMAEGAQGEGSRALREKGDWRRRRDFSTSWPGTHGKG
jgi:hypothetical protein